MTIADKTVLVTGANRGIGRALVAEALARNAKRVYAGRRRPLAHPDQPLRRLRDGPGIPAGADPAESVARAIFGHLANL